jgi:hypothetical protein
MLFPSVNKFSADNISIWREVRSVEKFDLRTTGLRLGKTF